MTISGCLIICPAWSQRSKKALIWHTGRTYSYSRDQMGTTDTTGGSGHSTKVISQECRLPQQVLFTGAALPIMLGQSARSEEHTSELQSRPHLVCRLLLEKKKSLTINYRPVLFTYIPLLAAPPSP